MKIKKDRVVVSSFISSCVLLFAAVFWSQRHDTSDQAILRPKLRLSRGKSIAKTPSAIQKFYATDLFYSVDSKKILTKVLSSSGKDVDNKKGRGGFHLWNASTGSFVKSWPLYHSVKLYETKEHDGDTIAFYRFFLFDTNQLGFYTSKIPYEEVRGDTIFRSKSHKIDLQSRKNIKDWLSFSGLSTDYTFIQLQEGYDDDLPIRSSDYMNRTSNNFRSNTIGKSSKNWPLQIQRDNGRHRYIDSIVYLSKDDKFVYFAGVDKFNGQPKLFLCQRGLWHRDQIHLPMEANRLTWNDSAEVANARLRFSPDGRFIAFTVAQLEPGSSSQDVRAVPRFIYIFDILKRRYQCKIACQPNVTSPDFAFSMDSRSVVAIEPQDIDSASLTLKQADSRLIDLKSGRTLRTFSAKRCGFDFFTRVAFAPSGREFALSGYGSQNLVRVFRYQ